MPVKQLYQHNIKGIRYEVFNEKPDIENLTSVKQVHSSIVIHQFDQRIEADGFVISSPQNRAFAIVTADCMPVVALGHKGVAFVHAGWKGVQNHILSPNNIGQIEPYHFFIGPHIMSCCYEVGKEFKEHFNNPEAFTNKQNKLYFNMARQLQTQLENDFHQCTIDEAKICTHCHSQFHSYRRDATQKRNWNILYY